MKKVYKMISIKYIFNSFFVSLMGYLIGYRYLLETIYRYQSFYCILNVKSFFIDWICHSDFPSLLSYSDFLSGRGVKHSIEYLVNKQDIKSPILVFSNEKSGYNCYVLISMDEYNVQGYDYKNRFFNKPKSVFDEFNSVYLEIERENLYYNSVMHNNVSLFVGVIVLFILSAFCFFVGFGSDILLFYLFNLIGACVSFMIINLKFFKNSSGILNSVCYLNKYFDCNRVISSINMYVEDFISFCSFSYFISNLFFATEIVSDCIVFCLVDGTALILTLILLIRQFFVVKKMCLFCLVVSLCVIFNVIITLNNINFIFNGIVLVHYIFVFALCIMLMYLILFNANMINTYVVDKRRLNSYIRNKDIFNSLLPSLIRYDVLNMGFELKNRDSLGDISIIISLSCEYCYDMFKEFVLVSQNYCEFSYRIIVLVNQSCENVYLDLKNVYLKQNYNCFLKYLEGIMRNGMKCDSISELQICNECEEIRSLQIERVPAILYNGYLLPSEYSLMDLCDLLEK